ncbi:hypothetical protein OIE52_32320 [Streptomyces canus]|uniref:hypothetical protein n=1 Tax=Streptomyces canus TaxID=58343 RepID=UPI002E2CDCBE|nr:hypothetical protein [Streptomyces canus]
MKRPARKRAIGSPPWSGTDACHPLPTFSSTGQGHPRPQGLGITWGRGVIAGKVALELDVAVVRRGPG